jgi:hypothetical protein
MLVRETGKVPVGALPEGAGTEPASKVSRTTAQQAAEDLCRNLAKTCSGSQVVFCDR